MKIGVYLDKWAPQDGGAHTFQAELVAALEELAGESQHDFVLLMPRNNRQLKQAKHAPLEKFYYRQQYLIEKIIALTLNSFLKYPMRNYLLCYLRIFQNRYARCHWPYQR